MSKNFRRIVISGSRDIDVSKANVEYILGFAVSQLVNMWGLAVFPTKHFTILVGYNPETKQPRGVDEIAYNYFSKRYDKVEPWPADWDQYGKGAGMIRNKAMVDSGVDAGIVLWNGWSPGTFNMIDLLDSVGCEYVLLRVPGAVP